MAGSAYTYQAQFPLLVLGPSIAAAIASDGWGKEEIRNYLFEHVLVDGDRIEAYNPGASGRHFSWRALADAGKAPPEYGLPGKVGKVRALLRPEWST